MQVLCKHHFSKKVKTWVRKKVYVFWFMGAEPEIPSLHANAHLSAFYRPQLRLI